MLFSNLSNPVSVIAIGVLLVCSLAYVAVKQWALYRSRQEFMRTNNCSTPQSVHNPRDPFLGIDNVLSILSAARKKRLLNWFHDNHLTYGNTWVSKTLARQAVHTIEAENVKTAFSLKFDDWSAGPARQALTTLLGRSTFMTDGAEWSHSRGILRPIFTKDQITDLDLFENHFQGLLKLLPSDGSTVDLDQLFNLYAFDVSSEFLFGESIGSLTSQTEEKARLSSDIELAIKDAADRARYARIYPFIKRKGADEAVRNTHSATDRYVYAALARAEEEEKSGEKHSEKPTKYSFLDELARQTKNPMKMRDEATSMIFAGKDTSATLLGNLWFQLARHPKAWENLLAEVDELQGELPTYDWIKNAKYLRYCEHEAMRLYPVVPLLPPRIANKDTILPLGGGSDGKSPMFVPKGTVLMVSAYCANRRKDVFGEDSDEFVPERWEDLRPGWAYIPFGGGPRICIGQQFALTEVYYITVRLLQHFRRIEPRDSRPFTEKMAGVTVSSANGVLVGLFSE